MVMDPRPSEHLDDRPFLPPSGPTDDQLLAHMIHDLKNPLSVILCYAEIIPDAEQSERGEYCQRLHANARALLDLLDGFALLSDLRDERVGLTHEPIDWARLVLGVVADLEPVAHFRGQRLACDTTGRGSLSGDRVKLTVAVRHLILEALRLGPPGATLIVRARIERDGAFVQVIVPAEQGGQPVPFDLQRPALELVQRVVRLHKGSLSLDQQAAGAVATVFLSDK
jgi:light-regulated signal transduction histidine kinase (bacteriophytochrome)